MRSSALHGTSVRFGGRNHDALDLVDAWASHVLRLFNEATADVDEDVAWTMYDLIAAIYIRAALQRALDASAEDLPSTVAVSDTMFRSFTVPDERKLLPRAEGVLEPPSILPGGGLEYQRRVRSPESWMRSRSG